MTKNILAVVGGLALVALLGANAVATFGGGEQSPSATGGGLRIADLPISRHFAYHDDYVDGGSVHTLQLTMPAIAGVAIERMTSNHSDVLIYIDGVQIFRGTGGNAPHISDFEPALVVRPGQTLKIIPASGGCWLSLLGYTIYDTDL